jgi:EAL domain-containing protein (putative c-di-GMP-specific phosphodiesterase class I)
MTLFDQLQRPSSIRIEFQPIVSIRNGETKLYALEALARGPRGTTVERPDVLFEYARRKGVETQLDLICISEILAAAATLPGEPSISINVHGSTISDVDDFARKILNLAEARGIVPQRLMLEILEHRAAWSMTNFHATLDSLRDAGVRIAVDDLGVGASNYRMIVDCRPDHLKVDRYIVLGCSSDRYRSAVLESVVTLARACAAVPIVEGIENVEDLEHILSLGIDLAQGWLYATSMPAQEIARSPLFQNIQSMKGAAQ